MGQTDQAHRLSARPIKQPQERKHIEWAEEEVYWIHSQFVFANGQAAESRRALIQARDEMMDTANRPSHPEMWRSFVERARVNRAIRAAVELPTGNAPRE